MNIQTVILECEKKSNKGTINRNKGLNIIIKRDVILGISLMEHRYGSIINLGATPEAIFIVAAKPANITPPLYSCINKATTVF